MRPVDSGRFLCREEALSYMVPFEVVTFKNMFTLQNDQRYTHVQVEGDRVRKRHLGHATLEAWTSSPKSDDSALPAGLKPLLHNIHSPTIPDWRPHTAAESGDFGSTRVCPPRGQRSTLSMYGGTLGFDIRYRRCLRTSNERCVRRRADLVLAVRSSSLCLR